MWQHPRWVELEAWPLLLKAPVEGVECSSSHQEIQADQHQSQAKESLNEQVSKTINLSGN